MTFEEKTISSEMIYEGAILTLRRDVVTVKDGRTSKREIIEHNGGAVILAVTPEGNIPMVRQYRKPAEKVMLELPAGKLEGDENPVEAARRELREETGYRAGKIEKMAAFYPTVGYSTEILHVYLATELTLGETEFDENEAIDIELIAPQTLYVMIEKGEINDAKTLIGLLLYKTRQA
jgi:ADP-ribose pyrophosphatase